MGDVLIEDHQQKVQIDPKATYWDPRESALIAPSRPWGLTANFAT